MGKGFSEETGSLLAQETVDPDSEGVAMADHGDGKVGHKTQGRGYNRNKNKEKYFWRGSFKKHYLKRGQENYLNLADPKAEMINLTKI